MGLPQEPQKKPFRACRKGEGTLYNTFQVQKFLICYKFSDFSDLLNKFSDFFGNRLSLL